MCKIYSMKKNDIKKYISYSLKEGSENNKDFWYTVQHLIAIDNYVQFEYRGNIADGTKKCVLYFISNYISTVSPDGRDCTEKECAELKLLNEQDYGELYHHIKNDDFFIKAKEWFNLNSGEIFQQFSLE